MCVARKPLAGTVAANVLTHGTGALNIDATRIAASDPQAYAAKGASVVGLGSNRNGSAYGEWSGTRTDSTSSAGRWPANVVLDEDQAAALDEQSGIRPGFLSQNDKGGTKAGEGWGNVGVTTEGRREGYNDTGGASRFFYIARKDEACSDSLEGAITTPGNGSVAEVLTDQFTDAPPAEGLISSEFNTSRFFYTAKADSGERIVHDGTAHPTVKPLSLMRWLVRLVTPPGGTVLDPFGGSGTTAEACLLEGFSCIIIEREAEYLPLIRQRINRRRDPVAYMTTAGEDLGLFADDEAV